MNRRAFLMTIASTLVPKIIRVTGLSTNLPYPFDKSEVLPPSFYNYKPHPAQVAFFSTPINKGVWLYGGRRGGNKSIIQDIQKLILLCEESKKGDPV